jgi:hypothetical protein
VKVDKRFLERFLDNVFGVLPNACVAERKRKNPSLVALEQIFKRLFVSVHGGNHKHLLACRIARACTCWFCCVIHTGLPISDGVSEVSSHLE